MNGPHPTWMIQNVSRIGLTLEMFACWPVLALSEGDTQGIYQQVANTGGVLFVRYGPHDTLTEYIGRLGGMSTEVLAVSDAPAKIAGREARSAMLIMVTAGQEVYREDADDGITHEQLPEARTRIRVIGFNHRGIPVLAGYRMPEQSIERYREYLERSLASISLA